MNETIENQNAGEPNLLDYLKILRARRKTMAGVVISALIITFIYSLLTPKIYQSTATLLPPVDRKELGLGIDISKVSQFTGISTPTTTTDVFMSMLKSRTMADAVIDKFNLLKVYDTKSRESARKRLQGDTRISLSKEKVISVSVEAPSPQLAANLANYYVEHLDELNQTVNITSAKRNRMFIEQRLNDTRGNLLKLEDLMQGFQTKHRAVSIEAQAKSAIDAAAELQGKLTAAEVQLQVMQNYLSPNNPDVIKLDLEIKEMARQLKKMEYGSKAVAKDYKDDRTIPPVNLDPLNPAFVKMPSLGMDLARLTREVKVQETLYTLLVSQYEQAKIQEARDTPTVQVLDRGIPPERKIKPSIRANLMLAFTASGLFSIFLAFFLEYFKSLRKK
ncbi:MAG: GumC family protein [Nitrospiria bacterium]